MANQDLQPAIVNANMSMTGASSSQMGMQQIDTERSSVSDRNSLDIDLPPEFASLFHVSYSFHFLLILDAATLSNLSSSCEVNPQIP